MRIVCEILGNNSSRVIIINFVTDVEICTHQSWAKLALIFAHKFTENHVNYIIARQLSSVVVALLVLVKLPQARV